MASLRRPLQERAQVAGRLAGRIDLARL